MPHSEDTSPLKTLGYQKDASKTDVDAPPVATAEQETPQPTKLKRPPGRPRKHPLPPPKTAEAKPSKFRLQFLPAPPTPNLWGQPDRFFSYWNGLTAAMLEHVEVRVYRNWPVIDRKQSGEQKEDIEIIEGTNPFGKNWEQGLLDRYGSGNYKLYMNEQPGGQNVCLTLAKTARDYNQYPPVLNQKELMLSDPLNASFISWLKNRNQFNPTTETNEQSEEKKKQEQEENEDMAVSEKLVDALIAERKNQPQPITVAPPASRDADASVKLLTQATETALRITEKAADRASETKSNAVDSVRQVESIVELAKSMKGDDNVLLTIMKQSEDRAARAEERSNQLLERLLTQQQQPAQVAPVVPVKSLVEQLREVNEINELTGLKKRRRNSEDDEDDDGEKKPNPADSFMGLVVSNLPVIAPMVQGVIGLLAHYGANAMYNAAVAKTGVGTPAIPTAPVQALPPQPNPEQQVQQTPSYTLTEEQQKFAQFHPFVAMMQPAIIKHLTDENLDGYTFAQWLIESSTEGRLQYDQLKSAGAENVIMLLKSYPPLWNLIAPSAWRLDNMIDMFMRYDEIKAQEDGDEEGDEVPESGDNGGPNAA